jgi:hypothetical protein
MGGRREAEREPHQGAISPGRPGRISTKVDHVDGIPRVLSTSDGLTFLPGIMAVTESA